MPGATGMNTLLAGLQPRDRARITDCCERVTLRQDEVLAEPGKRIHTVYFPTDSFIVVLAGINLRSTIGIGLIGKESMLGGSLVLGVEMAALSAKVAGRGAALQMEVRDFQHALESSATLDQHMRRHLYLQMRQMPLTAACAIFHVVERRLAYWLLMLHDRVSGDRIDLTHESLATILGVRRSGVSTAAGILQRDGLISYSRGHIIVLDRARLEAAACSCYCSERVAVGRLAPIPARRSEGSVSVGFNSMESPSQG